MGPKLNLASYVRSIYVLCLLGTKAVINLGLLRSIFDVRKNCERDYA